MGTTQGKKIKGRKRHLLVDTLGLVVEAMVHTAGIQDRVAGKYLVNKAVTNRATFKKGYADGGYLGKFLGHTQQTWGIDFEVVKRNEPHQFVVLPKRWIVERTNAWLLRSRRLAKDYERYAVTVRSWIFLAMIRLMVRRIEQEYTLC